MIAYEPPYSMLRRDIEISEIGFCRKFGVGITLTRCSTAAG